MSTKPAVPVEDAVRRRVFLSYAREDEAIALDLFERLEKGVGLTCWIDREHLRSGESYDPRIEEAIRSCTVLVVLYTENLRHSRYVHHEVSLALGAGKVVIPLRLSSIPASEFGAPFSTALERIQMCGSPDDSPQKRCNLLIRDLRHHIALENRQSGRRRLKNVVLVTGIGAVGFGLATLIRQGRRPELIEVLLKDSTKGSNTQPTANTPKALSFDLHGLTRGSSEWKPLTSESTLASGEHYCIALQPLTEGYLYVFQQDSGGKIQWLFPRNETLSFSDGSNPVRSFQRIVLPSGTSNGYALDKQTGTENVVAIMTSQPFQALEELLRKGESPPIKREHFQQLARKGSSGIERVPVPNQPTLPERILPVSWNTHGSQSADGALVLLRSFEHANP